jgi:hypothetical protein
MKSKWRSGLVALLIALASSATAASASAALPEFSASKYPVTFTGRAPTTFLQDEGSGYTCNNGVPPEEGLSVTGQIVGPKELAKVFIKFVSCKGLWKKCETKELKGRIAYLPGEGHRVGLLLESVKEPVAECTGVRFGIAEPAKITGSIIGELEPVSKTSTEFHLRYTMVYPESHQRFERFAGEELAHYLAIQWNGAGTPARLGVEGVGGPKLRMAERVELKA